MYKHMAFCWMMKRRKQTSSGRICKQPERIPVHTFPAQLEDWKSWLFFQSNKVEAFDKHQQTQLTEPEHAGLKGSPAASFGNWWLIATGFFTGTIFPLWNESNVSLNEQQQQRGLHWASEDQSYNLVDHRCKSILTGQTWLVCVWSNWVTVSEWPEW